MKICVIGAGAMGAIYAARLANAGHDLWVVDTWDAHVAAIQTDGLHVTGPDGTITAQVKAARHLRDVPPCGLYVIATKAAAVEAVAQDLARYGETDAPVITIQNGMGALERCTAHLPRARILLGVAEGFGASIEAPGHVRHANMRMIRLGEPGGGVSPRLEALVEVWRSGGFDTQPYADISQLIWEKFLCNVTLSGPCTVFDCTVGELMDTPEQWSIALGCMREAYALGVAKNIAFSFDDPEAYVTTFANAVRAARPSMLQDHRAGRRSEIDAINGAVAVMGKDMGIEAPYNAVVTAVVRSREAKF